MENRTPSLLLGSAPERAIEYIIKQYLKPTISETTFETALMYAENIRKDSGDHNVENVAVKVGNYFAIKFDPDTVLIKLVKALALNESGYEERDPQKMVKLVAEYIDIPIQEISRLIARRLVNVLDPELHQLGYTKIFSNKPGLCKETISPTDAQKDQYYALEASRFRFCRANLSDGNKTLLNWREVVLAKFHELRVVDFDHNNPSALTKDEIVSALFEIRDNMEALDVPLSRFDEESPVVEGCAADPLDKQFITALLRPEAIVTYPPKTEERVGLGICNN